MHPRERATFLLLLVTVVFLGLALAGDRDVAELLFEKAEKAYKKKEYAEASDYYQRALAESAPYPEAAYGLALALEKQKRVEEAIGAYLRCQDEVAALESPTRNQRSLASKAAKAVAKLGQGYAKLQEIDREFVKACLDRGRKSFNSHPEWAKRFFEYVLLVDPHNKLARSYLERLAGTEGAVTGPGGFEPFITDNRLSGWEGNSGPWTCSGRVITYTPEGTKGMINWKKVRLDGTYSYRASFRALEDTGPKRTFGVFFGHRKDQLGWALLIGWENDIVLLLNKGGDRFERRSKILSGFDATKWHVVRADVEPGKVAAFVDGEEIFSLAGEEADAFDGTPGLYVQQAKMEIKDVGVVR